MFLAEDTAAGFPRFSAFAPFLHACSLQMPGATGYANGALLEARAARVNAPGARVDSAACPGQLFHSALCCLLLCYPTSTVTAHFGAMFEAKCQFVVWPSKLTARW